MFLTKICSISPEAGEEAVEETEEMEEMLLDRILARGRCWVGKVAWNR